MGECSNWREEGVGESVWACVSAKSSKYPAFSFSKLRKLSIMMQSNLQASEDGYVICREGYTSAEGVLSHLNVVGELLAEAQKYADIVELSVQGPAEELEKLKEPLASMNAVHYPIFPGGIRNTKQW